MKKKIEKENIIKTKSEKGAITLFVLLACLFFVFTLTGVYISNVNRLKTQEQDIKQIQENYKRELDNIDEVYEEIASDGVTVTLTAEPEEWTQKVTLKGTGEVKEGKDIEIVKYAFTKDQDMPLSTDWKNAEESEKIKIEKTEEVTENGKYIFWVKDTEGNIYKSNEIEVKNIDTTLPGVGSIIAKENDVNGDVYDFNTWTDTDVYIEKVDGTDGESGHKSTTITVQKNGITMSEYTNVEGPITLTDNGTYTITVTTEDNAGNKATSEPYIVKIDKVVPELALKHNDANGADYEQGTWTKDNLYGEITIDTSNTGKTVEKYQYSYNGITWNDISAETAPTSLDYTTTFPMGEDKPDWISGPTNNGTYYFEVQEDGTLKPNNGGKNSTTANSYFELDLTEYPDAELEITLNTTISSENNYDFGYATITTSTIAPAYDSSTGQFIKVSGTTKTADYTTTITGGQKYYLHIGYRKDRSNSNNQDTFIINSITLKSDALGKTINFYNYTKQDNKVSFTLQDNIEEEIYIRAVYNSTENDTSRYTGKQSIKIDKKAPEIESTEPVILSKTDAKVNVKVVEEGSGLKGYYISTEDVAPTEQSTWTEQILKEFTIEGLKTETTYYLWTIDNVGNISEKSKIVIGTANYTVDEKISAETLEQAIEKATDGSTIQLLNDYTDTSTATISKNITFDVQSYTLTREATITINSSKTVEITGTGKIISGTSSVYTITNNGTLTISDKITIESTSTSYAPIYTNSSSSITNINDNVKIIGYYRGIYNYYGTVNVNGGYIEATYQSSSAYGIYNYSRSTVKTYIKGGEIRGYNGIYNGSSSTLEMTDGKVGGTGAYGVYAYGTTKIYGGRIEGKTYGLYSTSSNKITLGRQEDELSTTIPAIYGETYGIYMSNETYSFNFYNGKIISNTEETAYRGQVNVRTGYMPYTYFDYDVEQRYCTILVPTVEKITMEATPTEYTNGNVTVKITYPYNTDTKQYSENGSDWIDVEQYVQEIIVTENKTIYARTINESGIVTDENQIIINNIDKEKPTVTVTPTQTNYTVVETNGTVNLNISITAKDTGVSGLDVMQYAWAKEGEELTYTNFTNTVTINKTKLGIGQYYLYLNVTDKAGNKADLMQIRYNVKYQEPVAQIGSTKYTTIQDAIEACNKEAGETKTTITILKSTDEEFSTYEGQNIILDLKGYTVGSSSTETPICTNNGTLQIIDTSTNKTGKLESLNGTALQNNGTLTIGDNSTSIENDAPTIYGYKVGIENSNIFNFHDGKIQGVTPIKGNTTNTPEGYGPVSTDYNNGITTIQLGVVSGYEARIEWVYYTTVQEAIDATRLYKDGSRDTVTLIKDIQLKNTLNISSNKDMILDLDRYVLTIATEYDTIIENNGKLEITDSSIEQTGKIAINSSKNGTSTISTKAIKNNAIGKLVISGGNISSIATGTYNYAYGIYNYSGGTVKVTGGTVSSSSSNFAYGIYNSSGTVEVTGGTVSSSSGSSSSYNAFGIYNNGSGTVKVTGGTVSSNSNNNNSSAFGIYNSSGTVEVTGGTVSSSNSGSKVYTYGIYNNLTGTVKVAGGTVSSSGNSTYASYGIYNASGIVEVTGGTISCSSNYNTATSYGVYNNNTGTVKIVGGTVSSSGGMYAYGIYNCSSETVEVTGGTVTSVSIFTSGGSTFAYGISNESNGIVEITGGIVSGSADYAYGTYNKSTGTLIIGAKENGLVSQKNPLIIGKKNRTSSYCVGYGAYNSRGQLYFYNGIIQGNIALTGNVSQIREGYKIENNVIDETESIYLVERMDIEYLVQVDETKYYSLKKAIEDIGVEEKTIRVLKNFELEETIKFNKNIILDLNGYIITNNYYEISNIANLTITDTTKNKQGKIEFIETIVGIKNNDNGNLIITAGTVNISSISRSTAYGIYNNGGTVEVIGGTVSSSSSENITYGIYNDSSGIIEVTGGTVTSSGVSNYSAYGIYNTQGNLYYYDGRIEGTTKAIYNFITEREENTELNYNEDETVVMLTTDLIDIAQIGSTTYKTLQEAIDAAGTGQTTIKILRNATFTVNDTKVVVPNSKNITIDLNGYKINSSIEETFLQNEGILEITDTSENETGYLNSNTETTIKNMSGAKLTITGGTIENIKQTTIYNEGDLVVNEGTLVNNIGSTSKSNSYVIYNTSIGNVEVITGIVDNNNGNITASYSNNNFFGIFSDSTGYIKLIGGTIGTHNYYYYGGNNNSYGIYNANSGNLEILGGIIECDNQYNNCPNNNSYGVYNASTGSIEISSGSISSNMNSKYSSSTDNNNNSYGLYNVSTGNIAIGTKEDETISQEEPVIIGTYEENEETHIGYGIYNPNGTLNYYDGKIQGKDIALNGKISEIEELTELVISTETVEDEELQTLILKQIATNAVTMNGTEYESLSKAIKASGSTQNTIKLLRDIGLSSDAIIEANQNIIIDLNGYTISNYNAITNKGTLKIIDSSAGQTGKIINTILGTAISNIGTMELNSGTISDSAYGIKNTGILNITGGAIQNNSYGIYNDANGTVTITSGEITSNTYGIYNYDTTAVTNINGGIISSNEYGIYNYNGTTNIDSSGIANNTTYGIYNAGGTTNIKEGSQVQSQNGIYVANGTVNIGEQGTMNPDSPIITGENFGLEVSATGIVYMYDGQIKGKQGATQGFITHTETGYAVANKVDGEYYVDYLALAGTISTVAEVNGVSFSNLQSAINSVVGSEPQTVKLTNGIISTMTFNIAEGQNIILDMNGKTISSDLDVTINNAGTLVIIDSASSGVAKISSTVGTAINNTGTLILGQDDGTVAQDIITIEGQTYGITTSGTLNFYDGTINGASAVNGTITNRPSGYVVRTTTVNGKERYYLSV